MMQIGTSALWIAAHNGHLPVVQYFIEKVHVNIHLQDFRDGFNVLYAAAVHGHLEIVKYLLESCNMNPHSKIKVPCVS